MSTQSAPRTFHVTWDNARKNTRDPRRYEKQEAFGTQYPNGCVSLDNGAHFGMLSELEAFLEEHGVYRIVWGELPEIDMSRAV